MTCYDCEREIAYANQMEEDAILYWYSMREISAVVRDLPCVRDEIYRGLVAIGTRQTILELFTPQSFQLTEEELRAMDEHYRESGETEPDLDAMATCYDTGAGT